MTTQDQITDKDAQKIVLRYMNSRNIGALFCDTEKTWAYPSHIRGDGKLAQTLVSEKFEIRKFANLE